MPPLQISVARTDFTAPSRFDAIRNMCREVEAARAQARQTEEARIQQALDEQKAKKAQYVAYVKQQLTLQRKEAARVRKERGADVIPNPEALGVKSRQVEQQRHTSSPGGMPEARGRAQSPAREASDGGGGTRPAYHPASDDAHAAPALRVVRGSAIEKPLHNISDGGNGNETSGLIQGGSSPARGRPDGSINNNDNRNDNGTGARDRCYDERQQHHQQERVQREPEYAPAALASSAPSTGAGAGRRYIRVGGGNTGSGDGLQLRQADDDVFADSPTAQPQQQIPYDQPPKNDIWRGRGMSASPPEQRAPRQQSDRQLQQHPGGGDGSTYSDANAAARRGCVDMYAPDQQQRQQQHDVMQPAQPHRQPSRWFEPQQQAPSPAAASPLQPSINSTPPSQRKSRSDVMLAANAAIDNRGNFEIDSLAVSGSTRQSGLSRSSGTATAASGRFHHENPPQQQYQQHQQYRQPFSGNEADAAAEYEQPPPLPPSSAYPQHRHASSTAGSNGDMATSALPTPAAASSAAAPSSGGGQWALTMNHPPSSLFDSLDLSLSLSQRATVRSKGKGRQGSIRRSPAIVGADGGVDADAGDHDGVLQPSQNGYPGAGGVAGRRGSEQDLAEKQQLLLLRQSQNHVNNKSLSNPRDLLASQLFRSGSEIENRLQDMFALGRTEADVGRTHGALSQRRQQQMKQELQVQQSDLPQSRLPVLKSKPALAPFQAPQHQHQHDGSRQHITPSPITVPQPPHQTSNIGSSHQQQHGQQRQARYDADGPDGGAASLEDDDAGTGTAGPTQQQRQQQPQKFAQTSTIGGGSGVSGAVPLRPRALYNRNKEATLHPFHNNGGGNGAGGIAADSKFDDFTVTTPQQQHQQQFQQHQRAHSVASSRSDGSRASGYRRYDEASITSSEAHRRVAAPAPVIRQGGVAIKAVVPTVAVAAGTAFLSPSGGAATGGRMMSSGIRSDRSVRSYNANGGGSDGKDEGSSVAGSSVAEGNTKLNPQQQQRQQQQKSRPPAGGSSSSAFFITTTGAGSAMVSGAGSSMMSPTSASVVSTVATTTTPTSGRPPVPSSLINGQARATSSSSSSAVVLAGNLSLRGTGPNSGSVPNLTSAFNHTFQQQQGFSKAGSGVTGNDAASVAGTDSGPAGHSAARGGRGTERNNSGLEGTASVRGRSQSSHRGERAVGGGGASENGDAASSVTGGNSAAAAAAVVSHPAAWGKGMVTPEEQAKREALQRRKDYEDRLKALRSQSREGKQRGGSNGSGAVSSGASVTSEAAPDVRAHSAWANIELDPNSNSRSSGGNHRAPALASSSSPSPAQPSAAAASVMSTPRMVPHTTNTVAPAAVPASAQSSRPQALMQQDIVRGAPVMAGHVALLQQHQQVSYQPQYEQQASAGVPTAAPSAVQSASLIPSTQHTLQQAHQQQAMQRQQQQQRPQSTHQQQQQHQSRPDPMSITDEEALLRASLARLDAEVEARLAAVGMRGGSSGGGGGGGGALAGLQYNGSPGAGNQQQQQQRSQSAAGPIRVPVRRQQQPSSSASSSASVLPEGAGRVRSAASAGLVSGGSTGAIAATGGSGGGSGIGGGASSPRPGGALPPSIPIATGAHVPPTSIAQQSSVSSLADAIARTRMIVNNAHSRAVPGPSPPAGPGTQSMVPSAPPSAAQFRQGDSFDDGQQQQQRQVQFAASPAKQLQDRIAHFTAMRNNNNQQNHQRFQSGDNGRGGTSADDGDAYGDGGGGARRLASLDDTEARIDRYVRDDNDEDGYQQQKQQRHQRPQRQQEQQQRYNGGYDQDETIDVSDIQRHMRDPHEHHHRQQPYDRHKDPMYSTVEIERAVDLMRDSGTFTGQHRTAQNGHRQQQHHQQQLQQDTYDDREPLESQASHGSRQHQAQSTAAAASSSIQKQKPSLAALMAASHSASAAAVTDCNTETRANYSASAGGSARTRALGGGMAGGGNTSQAPQAQQQGKVSVADLARAQALLGLQL